MRCRGYAISHIVDILPRLKPWAFPLPVCKSEGYFRQTLSSCRR